MAESRVFFPAVIDFLYFCFLSLGSCFIFLCEFCGFETIVQCRDIYSAGHNLPRLLFDLACSLRVVRELQYGALLSLIALF